MRMKRMRAGTQAGMQAVRNGKRAGELFMLGIDILFLMAIILIFWKVSSAFTQENSNEAIGTSQSALLFTYSTSEKMLLYIDVAAQTAAFQSVHTLSNKGGSDKGDLGCGVYANYIKWTTSGKTCFTQDVDEGYKSEFKKNFKMFLAYPGLPSSMNYELSISSGKLIGKTRDEILLAIVTNKDGPQSEAGNIIASKNLAAISRAGFVQDSSVATQVTPSLNTKPRVLKLSRILITSTGTSDLASAMDKYIDGTTSVHYVINTDGKVVQLVPEESRASYVVCNKNKDSSAKESACKINDLEDTSVIVALVNPGPIAALSDVGTISTAGNDLCPQRGYEYSSKYEQCFAAYSAEQIDSLTSLSSDILNRRDMKAEDVLFEDEVSPSKAPGPALHSAQKPREMWEKEFKTLIVSSSAKKTAEQASNANGKESSSAKPQAQVISTDDLQVSLPLKSPSLLSCFGYRELKSKKNDFHDGIDLESNDDSVYAIADGVVYDACNKWVGDCACSIAPSINDNKCQKQCGGRSTVMCHNYGNSLVIAHSDSKLFSRYSHLASIEPALLEKGATVKKGQKIGVKGNTGYSEGKHLDLKIYNDVSQINANDKAINPLCIYPDSILAELKIASSAQSCNKYSNRISKDNPVLMQECKGITTLSASSGCGFSVELPQTSEDNNVQKTIDNIKKIDGLEQEIGNAANENDIDPKLMIAVITQESKGDPNAISPSGCIGIAQFCSGTAKGYESIFGPGIKSCGSPVECRNNPGDPRFDPKKSVKAQAKLLASNMQAFRKYTAKAEFTIAAYNGGGGVVINAIKKTGKSDPTWPEVAIVLDDKAIEEAYPHDSTYQKYFGTVEQRKKKAKEITDYVKKVGGYYSAQGGEVGAFGDVDCGDDIAITAKQLGTYSFNPSFVVDLPQTPVAQAMDFAKDAYENCDGEKTSSNKECLQKKVNDFNSKQNGFSISQLNAMNICEGDAKAIANGFSEFIEDCRNNMQTNCTCEYTMKKGAIGDNVKISVLLYSEYGRVYVDGKAYNDAVGDLSTIVKVSQDSTLSAMKLELSQAGGKKMMSLLPLSDEDSEFKAGTEVKAFKILKVDPAESTIPMAWLAYDDQRYPSCGAYKTTYPVCLQSLSAIYNPENGKSELPKVKFSLYLEDYKKPTAPVNLIVNSNAAVEGVAGGNLPIEGLDVSFGASDSKDVSYYNVSCRKTDVQIAENMIGIQLPVAESSEVKPANGAIRLHATETLKIRLSHCEGEKIDHKNAYEVIVVPIDLQGNVGDIAVARVPATKKDDSSNALQLANALFAASGTVQ